MALVKHASNIFKILQQVCESEQWTGHIFSNELSKLKTERKYYQMVEDPEIQEACGKCDWNGKKWSVIDYAKDNKTVTWKENL